MTESETIKKAIRHFECVKNDAVVVLDSGFGTRPGESNIVYRNRKMYAELAIQALEKQINDGWISVNDRLPEESYGCLVTVMDYDPYLMKDYENIYPEFVGWDGKSWNNSDGHEIPFEVLAWMPLPEPYKESDEL